MNIAGISVWGTVEGLSGEHWRRAIDVNLMGPIHVIECFVPPMIRAGAAVIVNVSSAASCSACPGMRRTARPNSACAAFPKCCASICARHGIHVNLVCPGGVDDKPGEGRSKVVGHRYVSGPR